MARAKVTIGLKCAPERSANVTTSAISAKPVASELARRAIAALPPARRSPMMPEPTTAARSSAVPTASAAADLIQLFLQRQALELLYGQREEKVDASAELDQRLLERATLVLVASLNRRRVRYAPMRPDRAPRGHTSAAADLQTVKTKSICGAAGPANSSQLFERAPLSRSPLRSSSSSANGFTLPVGWLPAL